MPKTRASADVEEKSSKKLKAALKATQKKASGNKQIQLWLVDSITLIMYKT